jgi:hypothetical protein
VSAPVAKAGPFQVWFPEFCFFSSLDLVKVENKRIPIIQETQRVKERPVLVASAQLKARAIRHRLTSLLRVSQSLRNTLPSNVEELVQLLRRNYASVPMLPPWKCQRLLCRELKRGGEVLALLVCQSPFRSRYQLRM